MRIRYVVVAALSAVGVAVAVPFLVTGQKAPSESAVPVPASTMQITARPLIVTGLADQLEAKGYRLAESDSSYSSDSARTTHSQTWHAVGQPTVYLTDNRAGAVGFFIIDTVSYGETGKFTDFWCAPQNDAARDLEFTVMGAQQVRAVVERGTITPTADEWVESTYLVGSHELDCYMSMK